MKQVHTSIYIHNIIKNMLEFIVIEEYKGTLAYFHIALQVFAVEL